MMKKTQMKFSWPMALLKTEGRYSCLGKWPTLLYEVQGCLVRTSLLELYYEE